MANQTRSLLKAGILLVFVLGFPVLSIAQANTPAAKVPVALQKCISGETGIEFSCDPLWKLNRQGKTLKITISENPLVEMVVEESDQTIHFMSEFSEEAFAVMGRYEEGFHFEHQTRCGREAIKINGYLQGKPQTRVSDFYLANHLFIHSVKFTIDPKEAFEEYKWLIKEIIDSVNFVKHKPGVKFFSEEIDETCEELVK